MSLQRWAEILTVGLPFCVFKLLTGVITLASPVGYALLALGFIDLALNLVNLVSLVVVRRRVSAVCLTELVLGRYDANLGLALDVFLSFALVALVVGFGWIVRLPPWALPVWNLAVVLNVLGAGAGRLYSAVRRVRAPA